MCINILFYNRQFDFDRDGQADPTTNPGRIESSGPHDRIQGHTDRFISNKYKHLPRGKSWISRSIFHCRLTYYYFYFFFYVNYNKRGNYFCFPSNKITFKNRESYAIVEFAADHIISFLSVYEHSFEFQHFSPVYSYHNDS